MHIIEEKVCQTEIATGEESLSNSKLKVVKQIPGVPSHPHPQRIFSL